MHSDHVLARPTTLIPPRNPCASRAQVDLSDRYNTALDDDHHHKPGNKLAGLPKGLQVLGGITFDIRGLVQLSGARSADITGLLYPDSEMGIPVQTRGTSIHFLHASAWDFEEPSACIGEYVLHYENRPDQVIPIVYKENIWDWWSSEIVPSQPPVWKGQNERTSALGQHIRLFKLSVELTHPDIPIRSMDFISKRLVPAPFLVAVTIDQESQP